MKLNDFIKQEPTPKKSGYKVVVGNTPKERELEKQASQAAVLESSLTAANLKVDELQKENQFLKEQVKINQHEKDEFKNILNGIEMIENELLGTLEKNSIKYIDCINKPFDPNLHQAIGEKDSEKEPGIVIEEMQKGYLMHDRLLRPSMVYVSKKAKK